MTTEVNELQKAKVGNDHDVFLALSTVDGHLSAMLVCAVCENILIDTDWEDQIRPLSALVCDHGNSTTVWEYLGRPL